MAEPTLEVFKKRLDELFALCEATGVVEVTVNAGMLHRAVGRYPNKNHRMPVCCKAMYSRLPEGDLVVEKPPKGEGASLTIKYRMPRETIEQKLNRLRGSLKGGDALGELMRERKRARSRDE